MPTTPEAEHLLRRTEYVARQARVDELVALPTLAAAVDNVLAVPSNPGSATLSGSTKAAQGEALSYFWFDRMAHDSPRPIQEKMAFFWHGLFCTDLLKAGNTAQMRDQIDLFRREGLTNFRALAVKMSTTVAMLRYLDNWVNKSSSPNQNFARELMELFVLGVGNYTEADVEAGTAAWTGHSAHPTTFVYEWHPEWHDSSTKLFLGQTINAGPGVTQHGAETITVMLGAGVVPHGAAVSANRGRPTREVAAEFISRKLWREFADTAPPEAVVAALRDVAIANDFAVKPWVRALLLRPEFYDDDVRRGRVRTPVEYWVALMVATGLRGAEVGRLGLLDGMGQRPLWPPDVSGWGNDDAFVTSGAMAFRVEAARTFLAKAGPGYWTGDGQLRLPGGTITKTQVDETWADQPLFVLDRFLDYMRVEVSSNTYSSLASYAQRVLPWQRIFLVSLILMSPDLSMA